jgi:AFG3 family protein
MRHQLQDGQRNVQGHVKVMPADECVCCSVTLCPQVSIVSTLLEFLPTLLFFGWAYWLVSRQMRNMPGGFGGGGNPLSRMGRNGGSGSRGAGGFFGMAKANVTSVDKNAKDKVGCQVFRPANPRAVY